MPPPPLEPAVGRCGVAPSVPPSLEPQPARQGCAWAPPSLARLPAPRHRRVPGTIRLRVGVWLSLVERSVRDREVGGSNPPTPTSCPFPPPSLTLLEPQQLAIAVGVDSPRRRRRRSSHRGTHRHRAATISSWMRSCVRLVRLVVVDEVELHARVVEERLGVAAPRAGAERVQGHDWSCSPRSSSVSFGHGFSVARAGACRSGQDRSP